MKTKILLPMLTFICAVGMAFTSTNLVGEQSTGYIFRDNMWQPVNVSCETELTNDCLVKFSEGGQEYIVYESDLTTERTGSGEAILIEASK